MRIAVLVALAACQGSASHERAKLAVEQIVVQPGAKLSAGEIGESGHRATFVLVDAVNRGSAGAYVTLGGELGDAAGKPIDPLAQQTLYIPGGEARTYSLIDRAQAERPDAKGAQIVVRSATVPLAPPPVRVDGIREVPDDGKLVVQGVVHNDAPRAGEVVVIAAFRGADQTPMSRPFTVLHLAAKADQPVQLVGPPGAAHATIYIGDVTF